MGTLNEAVRHLGYDPGNLSEEEKLRMVQESQERLANTKVIPDSRLTPEQLSSLSLAKAIAGEKVYAADIPPASDRVRTAGMYSRSSGDIYISVEQLNRGRETLNTIIHELAHHTTGAGDGEPEHASEITRIVGEVVDSTRRGEFDRYLSRAFVW